MDTVMLKARCENGRVYFIDMPHLNECSFEFVAGVPQERLRENLPSFLRHLPKDEAQAILEKMQNERQEYEQILHATLATDAKELSEKQQHNMQAFALYDQCK